MPQQKNQQEAQDKNAVPDQVTTLTDYEKQVQAMQQYAKDNPPVAPKPTVGNAPQEHNLTGVLDHSEYPAKLKDAPDAAVPDATPETVQGAAPAPVPAPDSKPADNVN